MVKYLINRFAMALLTLWAVITLTFIIMHSIPGNPFASESAMPQGVYDNLKRYYNLDKPLVVQYGMYLKSLAQFDFGPSIKSVTLSVNKRILKGFPVSAHLGLQALLIAVTLGLVLGTIAALNHNKWLDYLAMIFAIICISVPSFILATLLMNYMAVEWKVLPVAGWKSWSHTVLPSISLAMMPTAYIARLMRSSMLEVLSQDYIKTAKAKGLSQSVMIIKHAIRNAILPVVTVLGTVATNLVVGSFIIENIFGIPGMGDMFVKGILDRDYPVILGAAVFYSGILILLTLLVDVAYTLIDPRIQVLRGSSNAH